MARKTGYLASVENVPPAAEIRVTPSGTTSAHVRSAGEQSLVPGLPIRRTPSSGPGREAWNAP